MDSTPKFRFDPADFASVDDLLDKLLENVEFTAYPVDLIGGTLQQLGKVADAIACADPQDVAHLAETAREQANVALSLVLAWDRQQREVRA